MSSQTTPGLLLDQMRQSAPLVQCITNFVAMNIAANVLLAVGASPAMVHDQNEAAEFAAIAGAVTINIGTISPEWLDGMMLAARAAAATGRPWILDPVAHFATGYRRQSVERLMALRPTIVRGNASEIIALAGGQSAGQGADSRDGVEQAEASATTLAREHRTVVAVTGEIDFITDGDRAVRIKGGSPLMPRVTALGCSLTCLIGAFAAARPDEPFEAAVGALASFAVAGERAASLAAGPGSFSWRFLDALAELDGKILNDHARVSAA
jgi:hydroxyethylthiazole kinase